MPAEEQQHVVADGAAEPRVNQVQPIGGEDRGVYRPACFDCGGERGFGGGPLGQAGQRIDAREFFGSERRPGAQTLDHRTHLRNLLGGLAPMTYDFRSQDAQALGHTDLGGMKILEHGGLLQPAFDFLEP